MKMFLIWFNNSSKWNNGKISQHYDHWMNMESMNQKLKKIIYFISTWSKNIYFKEKQFPVHSEDISNQELLEIHEKGEEIDDVKNRIWWIIWVINLFDKK